MPSLEVDEESSIESAGVQTGGGRDAAPVDSSQQQADPSQLRGSPTKPKMGGLTPMEGYDMAHSGGIPLVDWSGLDPKHSVDGFEDPNQLRPERKPQEGFNRRTKGLESKFSRNIFDPPRGSVAFVVYSAFIYFSPVVMRVIRTAILWYEHEFNHLTSADWSADKITVIVADSTEDMMSHAYVRDRNIQFLSIDDIHKSITKYPPLKPILPNGSDIVTVTGAKLRDVSEPSSTGFDGTAGSLRAELLTPTNNRYVSWIFQNPNWLQIEKITYSLTMLHIIIFHLHASFDSSVQVSNWWELWWKPHEIGLFFTQQPIC